MNRAARVLAGLAAGVLLTTAVPASAQTVQMTATLTGGDETPILLTGASGTAAVSVDMASQELVVTLTLYNFPAGTTAGHIHVGAKGVAGPVVLDFPIPTGRTGDLALNFRVNAAALRSRPEIGIGTMADAIQAIITGNAYVNIHTTANPAGEIRGQLTRVE